MPQSGAYDALMAVHIVHANYYKKTKRLRQRIMQPEILGKTIESLLKNLKAPTPSDKLTGKLTDTKPDEVTELLTSVYSQLVANRGRTLEREEETSEKIRKVSNWLTVSPKPGLLLYGNTGTGKTILMESLKEVLKFGRPYDAIRFITARDLFYKFTIEPDHFTYGQTKSSPVAFIDDLGCEPPRCLIYGVEHTPIRDFFYDRYKRQLITIVSTNLDDKQLLEIYGERVWDRMQETFDRITFQGKSFRTK